MAEEKFEFPPPTAAELRELEERASTRVDSRAMAAAMRAERVARPSSWAAAFRETYGFDPGSTLTELEGFDAGDGFAVADEPEVHALRRVPLSYWTVQDAFLMLAYDVGAERTLAFALDLMSSVDFEAEGALALLDAAARRIAQGQRAAGAADARALIEAAMVRAEAAAWCSFEASADAEGLSADERASERERLRRGRPASGQDPFWRVAFTLNDLARARQRLVPPPVLRHALAEIVYAVYRPRRGLDIVPPRDFADPAIRARLEHPDTFYFRRETYLDLVPAGAEGVRLRHYAESSCDSAFGIAFDGADEALAYAESEFGVARSAWQPGPPAAAQVEALRLWP